MRVLTNHMDVSDDKEQVKQEADYNILGVNALQQAAKIGKKGNMLEAQVYAKAQNRFIRQEAKRHNQQEAYDNFRQWNEGQYD